MIPSVGVPRDVGRCALVVFVAYIFSVQFCPTQACTKPNVHIFNVTYTLFSLRFRPFKGYGGSFQIETTRVRARLLTSSSTLFRFFFYNPSAEKCEEIRGIPLAKRPRPRVYFTEYGPER